MTRSINTTCVQIAYDRPDPNTLVLFISSGFKRRYIPWIVSFLCILRCRIVYFHSVLSIGNFKLLFRIPFIKKILDVHGVVPEEFRFHGDIENSEYYSELEMLAAMKSNIVIFVSDAMRRYFIDKYLEKFVAKSIILPIFQNIDIQLVEKSYKNKKPIIVYAGGLQKWQQIDIMINLIEQNINMYLFRFYSPYPDEFEKMVPKELINNPFLEIGSKSNIEILENYLDCHFQFILREDVVVNKVACPTKLVEYLATGIVPIMDYEYIGDFKCFRNAICE